MFPPPSSPETDESRPESSSSSLSFENDATSSTSSESPPRLHAPATFNAISDDVMLYHVFSFLDFQTLQAMCFVSRFYLRQEDDILGRLYYARIRKRQASDQEEFERERAAFVAARSALSSESEKREFDREFQEETGDNFAEEVRTFLYQGVSFMKSMESSMGRVLRLVRSQVLSGMLPLDTTAYIGNGDDPVNRFFCYTFPRGLRCMALKYRWVSVGFYEAYFQSVLDVLRFLKSAGMEFPRNSLIHFVWSSSRTHQTFNRRGSVDFWATDEAIEAWKQKRIDFVRFLIDEFENDPFEVMDFCGEELCAIEMAAKTENYQLLCHMANPFRMLRKRGEKEKFEIFVNSVGRMTKYWFSSKRGGKCFRKVMRVPETRSRILELFPQILFDLLIPRKDRKMLSFLIRCSKEQMRGLRDKSSTGDTILHRICQTRGCIERIVSIFVRVCECDLEARNEEGETPLMCAIRIKHFSCVRLLLSLGARIEACDGNGVSCGAMLMSIPFLPSDVRSLVIAETGV